MKIAVPRETLEREYRVGLTPDAVRQLVGQGHSVLVERGAGAGSGFSDEDYARAGATLVGVEEAWGESELVVQARRTARSRRRCSRRAPRRSPTRRSRTATGASRCWPR